MSVYLSPNASVGKYQKNIKILINNFKITDRFDKSLISFSQLNLCFSLLSFFQKNSCEFNMNV